LAYLGAMPCVFVLCSHNKVLAIVPAWTKSWTMVLTNYSRIWVNTFPQSLPLLVRILK